MGNARKTPKDQASAVDKRDSVTSEGNLFAIAQAAAALKSITLTRIDGAAGPAYVVSRWGMSC
jgi:hypothetical protein